MNFSITRRGFAGRLAAACALPAFPAFAAPSETVALGIIGYGHRARQVMPCFLYYPDVRVVAVCDVVRERREAARKAVDECYSDTSCAAYGDFRRLLERKDIDAVYVALGDRWHARMAIEAMRAGKDVYCEKPIALTPAESIAVVEAEKRFGRIYQGGVQRRNVGNFVAAVKIAKSGRLGAIRTCYAGMSAMGLAKTNHHLPAQPRPNADELDWDMWLGPAPERPFNSAYVDGAWHDQFDFHGDLTEWGSHTVDLCQVALGRLDASPTRYSPVSPHEVHATFEDGVKIVLKDGYANSCLVRFEGADGWVEADDGGMTRASDPELLKGLKIKGEGWERPVNHPREFIDCVKSRARTTAPAKELHHPHLTCFAATAALHLGRELAFDPKTATFPADAEATARLSRTGRGAWSKLLGIAALCGFAALGAVAGETKIAATGGVEFVTHRLNTVRSEACGIADFDGDGRLDIIAGEWLYPGPDYKPRRVIEVKSEVTEDGKGYAHDFMNLTVDMNLDGKIDVVSGDWFSEEVWWSENVLPATTLWPRHVLGKPGNVETGFLVDVDGDGKATDILVDTWPVTYYTPAKEGAKQTTADTERCLQGRGCGDLNGDGRNDVITPFGWYENTPAGFKKHPYKLGFERGNMSHASNFIVFDVNKDGLNDLIVSAAHCYGIYWYEQLREKDDKGEIQFERHLIDKSWSQAHYLAWADIDNDGVPEIVTGKRHLAHNGFDAGGLERANVYYYDFTPGPDPTFTRYPVCEGRDIGAGMSVEVADLDGDGDLDLVTTGKYGGPVMFENRLRHK